MKLSIVTATFNAALSLPSLVESLRQQSDQDFEWVVMDGASTDCTLAILAESGDLPVVYRSEPDFGIYDALNKAIKLARGEYYLVVGADDILCREAVANYKELIEKSGADIVTASVRFGSGNVVEKPHGSAWLHGQLAYVTAHAVGSAYRKSLHDWDGVGYYVRKYPIAADQLFIKRAVRSGARIAHGNFVAGSFGEQGLSSVDLAGALTEFFRVQLETEKKGMQILLFLVRILKYFPRLIR